MFFCEKRFLVLLFVITFLLLFFLNEAIACPLEIVRQNPRKLKVKKGIASFYSPKLEGGTMYNGKTYRGSDPRIAASFLRLMGKKVWVIYYKITQKRKKRGKIIVEKFEIKKIEVKIQDTGGFVRYGRGPIRRYDQKNQQEVFTSC